MWKYGQLLGGYWNNPNERLLMIIGIKRWQ